MRRSSFGSLLPKSDGGTKATRWIILLKSLLRQIVLITRSILYPTLTSSRRWVREPLLAIKALEEMAAPLMMTTTEGMSTNECVEN
jgi:hypothetical protein